MCDHVAVEEFWINPKKKQIGVRCAVCGGEFTRSEFDAIREAQHSRETQRTSSGQRWEPCPRCGTEPVCNDCGYCDCHCTCASDALDRQQVREFNRSYPGFLQKVAEHQEQGGRER